MLGKSHVLSHIPNRRHQTYLTPPDTFSRNSRPFRRQRTSPTECSHLIIPRSWVRSPPALPALPIRPSRRPLRRRFVDPLKDELIGVRIQRFSPRRTSAGHENSNASCATDSSHYSPSMRSRNAAL